MEATGLAVGIAGLAGLFSACIDCFELVQRGRYLGKDYDLLETKFNNQWRRLTAWGRACGFTSNEGQDKQIFQDDGVRSCVESTLLQLLILFQDGDQLNRRYGLTKAVLTEPGSAALLASADWTATRRAALSMLGRRLRELKDRVAPSSTPTGYGISKRAKWAVQDKEKFADLIQHMRDLIEDLEGMTSPLGVQERQRELIKHDIESITDISTLQSVEEARVGRVDTVADAATFQLWNVRDGLQSASGRDPDTSSHGQTSTATEVEWEIVAEPLLAQTPGDVHFQLLHRVHCDLSQTSVFFDVPDYICSEGANGEWVFLDKDRPSNSFRSFHLCGKRPLRDLEAYLAQNTQLDFVAFQEYRCNHDKHGTDLFVTIFGQSIHLASEKLCVDLRNLSNSLSTPFPPFGTMTELQFPYYWHYRLRYHDVQKESASVRAF
ncbi:hypothetical protein PG993_002894 [Apiospora rasikravindrae]|uniref:Prion-inhibition and propagation HeLo domain-containing protein n=1 Tax=Apiospora rasikravindrae TaxID=990691 RepID=A0ABR1TXY8_9PEZI